MRTSSPGWGLPWLAAFSAFLAHANGAQATFPSPEEAVSTLVGAVEAGNYPLFLAIVGDGMAGFWGTGDLVRDILERNRFLDAARTWEIRIDRGAPDRRRLYVGGIAEPFPAPLIKTDAGWRFDGEAGSVELTVRQIRRNEEAAMELCRRMREAQFTYVDGSYGRDSAFAQKIRSTPGEHDGLFWSGGEGDESPLGPVFAAAAYAEKSPSTELRPLFGYYFRLLSGHRQPVPSRAPADRRNRPKYEDFAFIAWPAEYGVAGIRSFLITQSGEIYHRDLGADGHHFAESVSGLQPDRGWKRLDIDAAVTRGREE